MTTNTEEWKVINSDIMHMIFNNAESLDKAVLKVTEYVSHLLQEREDKWKEEIKTWVKNNTHDFDGAVNIDGILDAKEFLTFLTQKDTK